MPNTPAHIDLEKLFSKDAGIAFVRIPEPAFLLPLNDAEFRLFWWLLNHYKVHAREINDGWFYCLDEWIRKKIGFDRQKTRRTLATLRSKGLLETTTSGMPRKRWYRFCEEEINRRLEWAWQDYLKTCGLDVEKLEDEEERDILKMQQNKRNFY